MSTYEPNIESFAWASLGALLMLTAVLVVLVVFPWRLIAAHVTTVIAEAGKRAIDERFGKKRRSGQVVKLQRAPVREESRKP